MSTQASILAIGTELTTGQITNTNARWLAERLLAEFGVQCPYHLTVPDSRAQIADALSVCASRSSIIFVIGGLGPTSDDFTREVLASWSGLPLEYDEASWTQIQKRLTSLGVPVAEANRQQCFYPRGSQIFVNSAGTANAFSFSMQFQGELKTVFAWPGPPREIEVLWRSPEFQQSLLKAVGGVRPPVTKLFTYQCLGKSEAELGEIVEAALTGSDLERGYRAYIPFVEIKLWMPDLPTAAQKSAQASLEKAIQPWIASRQGEDLAALFWKKFESSELLNINDRDAQGVFCERLIQGRRSLSDKPRWERKESLPLPSPFIHLSSKNTHTLRDWQLQTSWGFQSEWSLPFEIPSEEKRSTLTQEQLRHSEERAYRMAAEIALARLVANG